MQSSLDRQTEMTGGGWVQILIGAQAEQTDVQTDKTGSTSGAAILFPKVCKKPPKCVLGCRDGVRGTKSCCKTCVPQLKRD